MLCPKCGWNNAEGAQLCAACGAQMAAGPQPTEMPMAAPKTSAMAIWSLVLGLLGLVTCGMASIAGLILGILGLKQVKEHPQDYSGSGLAVAGIALSVIMFLVGLVAIPAAVFFPVFVRAKSTAQSTLCLVNAKQLSMGMRMYLTDYQNTYPPAASWCDATKAYAVSKGTYQAFSYVCPVAPNLSCGYGINGSVGGQPEGAISSQHHTVLLFESDRGWNAFGGREAMITKPRHQYFTIIAADGHAIKTFPGYENSLQWSP